MRFRAGRILAAELLSEETRKRSHADPGRASAEKMAPRQRQARIIKWFHSNTSSYCFVTDSSKFRSRLAMLV
jgi:hypothetical protein